MNNEGSKKYLKQSVIPKRKKSELEKMGLKIKTEGSNKGVVKRRVASERKHSEWLEKMARLHIEEVMTRAVVRKCPACGNPIVKTEGCDIVVCPCGETFCYRCGREILNCRLYCQVTLNKNAFRAAIRTKRQLKRRYPTLKFIQCISLFNKQKT